MKFRDIEAMPTCTLEDILTEAEDSLRSRLRDWIAAPPRAYPLNISVLYEEPGEKNRQVAKLVINKAPSDVQKVLDELRKQIVDQTEGQPVGIMRIKGWCDGHSADPDINYRRTLSAPGYAVDGEKVYLRDRIRSLERQVESFVAHTLAHSGQTMERLVGMGDLVQKLGVTRAAASTSAEVSPTTMLIAAITLPAVLPAINKAMGIKPDAPITETFKRAQLMTAAMVQTATRAWEEGEPGPAERGTVSVLPRTVRQLVDDTPAAAPDAPADTPPATPPVVIWPAPVALVEHLAEDDSYRSAVVAGLLEHPRTRQQLREQLPVITLALEMHV